MNKFKEIINGLEKLIDNTENGCYDYDYKASLDGELFYIKIIIKYASLYEMSCFLKDYQILIEKEPKTFYEVGE